MEHLITEIYENIVKKQPIDNLGVFMEDYETYEEIPIINRLSQVSFINNIINKKELTYFLHQIAVYYVNNILLYAKSQLLKEEFSEFFIAIVYIDMEEDIEDGEVCIPSICVSRKKQLFNFLQEKEKSFDDMICLKSLVNLNNATYHTSHFLDNASGCNINRIYIVPKYDTLIDIRHL